ncbi:MAG: hypothetical protein KME32_30745 [Mojavia pulchra JT2-VF2]|jgi:hypothetical protein|uniref:DUF2917 domain-containing protein n=1 Tax=Mojavia pulchra JT2-VF2 TaxID=287848 RepID=A0A951Q6F0_9NOST|nr:hypothetical protein [Mojavia pulchra JT2-VF2]
MKLSNILKPRQNVSLPILLTLNQNQSLRIPQLIDEVQVLSGGAWITVAGQDIILTNQEITSIPQSKDGAIISPISQEPLVFELRTKEASLI